MTLKTKPPRHFRPVGNRWRNCHLEGNRMYPESEMVEYQGKWYCQDCWEFRHSREKEEESDIDVSEDY